MVDLVELEVISPEQIFHRIMELYHTCLLDRITIHPKTLPWLGIYFDEYIPEIMLINWEQLGQSCFKYMDVPIYFNSGLPLNRITVQVNRCFIFSPVYNKNW